MSERFNCKAIRRKILNMSFAGSSVHVPCAFSLVEVLAVLYRSFVRIDPADPNWPNRDYVILSKGHGVMAQYACLHEIGWLADDELERYFGDGTRLKGLSDAHIPGIEVTSGSLGHGLSVACGLALAAKRLGTDQRTFCVVGDGEANEGSIWEAILFAAHQKLSNLCVIIDANRWQAMGRTEEVMDMGDIREKLAAFGLEACDCPGHDEEALHTTFARLLASKSECPKAVVAHTTKGHGVSFIADRNLWHYTRLTADSHRAALAECV